jgi:hypothetical protein
VVCALEYKKTIMAKTKTSFTEHITIFDLIVRNKITNVSGVNKKDGKIELFITGGVAPYVIILDGNRNNGSIMYNLAPKGYVIKVIDSVDTEVEFNVLVG